MKLATSEVHVWLAFDRELTGEALVASFTSLLDAGERQRAARFRAEEHTHQFLVTRALQRAVLSHYEPEVSPAAWRFVTGERGKPALAPEFAALGLQFNVSHTPKLVAMAVTRSGQVGVDVESLADREAPLALAQRYFTAREAWELAALPAAGQQRHFFRLWTLKEAWLKATGIGVAQGLAEISFARGPGGELQTDSIPGDDPSRWQFWQGQPDPQHLLAIAAHSPWMPLELSVFRRRPTALFDYHREPPLPLVIRGSGQEQSSQP